jgi:hypothetical protein
VIDRFADAVCDGGPALESCTLKLDEPGAVGVPEITPVEAFSESPAGRAPLIVHVEVPAPPTDCSVALYGTPATAAGSDAVVTERGGAEKSIIGKTLVAEPTSLRVVPAARHVSIALQPRPSTSDSVVDDVDTDGAVPGMFARADQLPEAS